MDEIAKTEAELYSIIERFGLNPLTMSARTLAEIEKVEGTLFEMLREAQHAREIIKAGTPTIKTLSLRSGISRATFYNNKDLDTYTRARTVELFPEHNIEENLREQLKSARQDIHRMQERDGMILLLKIKVDELEDEIKALENDLERERAAHFDTLKLMQKRANAKNTFKVITKTDESKLKS